MNKESIERAKEHFGRLLARQMDRMEQVKSTAEWVDYSKIFPIKIGMLGGDGIGQFHVSCDNHRPGAVNVAVDSPDIKGASRGIAQGNVNPIQATIG